MAREVEELKASDLEALEARARATIGSDRFLGFEWAAFDNAFQPDTVLALIALARRSLPSPEAGWRPTHRHRLRGTSYVVIGSATLQRQQSKPLPDETAMTVYRDKAGALWVRSTAEFNDGRFEVCAVPPSPEAGGAEPAAEGRGLRDALHKALCGYRLSNMGDEDGTAGYPLVDLCSNDGTSIETGQQELDLLADFLASDKRVQVAISSRPPPPAPEAGGVIAEARELAAALSHPFYDDKGETVSRLADLAERQASEIERKDAEIADLTAEATQWSEAYGRVSTIVKRQASDLADKQLLIDLARIETNALVAKNRELDAENARLRGALEPFANITVEGEDHSAFSERFPEFAKRVAEAKAAINPTKGAGA